MGKKINQPQMLNSTWDKQEGRPLEFNNFGAKPKLRTRSDQDDEIVEFIPKEKTMAEFINEFGFE